MPLGLRSEHSSDYEIVFERELAAIRSFASQDQQWFPDSPVFEAMFRPTRYHKKRWPDASTLENEVLMGLSFRDRDGSRFPPSQVGTKRMDWGIFNNTYGFAWALTYSGQFWLSLPLGAYGEIQLSARDLTATWPRRDELTLRDGEWIRANESFNQIAALFQLLKKLSGLLHKSEVVRWSIQFSELRNKWINFHATRGSSFGPCAESELSRDGRRAWTT